MNLSSINSLITISNLIGNQPDYFQENNLLAYHGFSCYINQSVHDDDLDMAEWTVEFGNSKFLLTVSKTYNERDFELTEVFL